MSTSSRVAIITPSYRNDFELARDLSRSLDEFARFDFEHILMVPDRDRALFSELGGERRRIVTPDSYLRRHGFYRLPLPTRVKLPFRKPMKLREQYFAFGAGRLSGWLMQQIVKLSANDFTDAPLLIFADSDVALVRPFTLDMLWVDGKLRLQQHPRPDHLHRGREWHDNAHVLLGIEPGRPDLQKSYIGNLVVWKRETLAGMIEEIQRNSSHPWRSAVARMKEISEYILYGEYVTERLGAGSGHQVGDRKLYNSIWWPDEQIDIEAIMRSMEPQHVALHIQSTHPLPIEERRRAIDAVRERLVASDTKDSPS